MHSDENFSAGKISEIVAKIEKENAIFAKKSALDSLSLPLKILGREKQIEFNDPNTVWDFRRFTKI